MSKFLAWVKGLGILATLGAILTAIFMALAGAKAGRQRRRAERAEAELQGVQHDNTKKALQKAEKLKKEAATAKEAAANAAKKAETHLEALGEANEDIDDIAHRFNSRRLRNG